jgi:hypothetical protein
MSTAEIQRMPRAEKLKLMEVLWADLSRDEALVESPAWHAEELRKTQARVAAGQEEIVDWEEGKKRLRKMFE